MEILSALCTPAIICNEKAWDSIDNKILKIFEDLSNKLCSDDNYREYHNVLKSTPNPCVPFLGNFNHFYSLCCFCFFNFYFIS